MRTNVYVVEHKMPGNLPPTRNYSTGPNLFLEENRESRLIGYIEGPRGTESFVLSSLLAWAMNGEREYTWHPLTD